MSKETTGDIPSAGRSGEHSLETNTVIVVLGASGDLAKKKLISHGTISFAQTFPALFGLYNNGFLPKGIRIVGYARTKMDEEEYHKRVVQYIKTPIPAMKKKLEEFVGLCTYVSGQYDDDESFQGLEKELKRIESEYEDKGSKNRVFYMALPPSVFTTVAQHLKTNNYSEGGINRIIVEKPFGKDLESSREMQEALKKQWKEDEIYRIDHYLGKEMVKNLLVLRFANVMLDASFNKSLISNVQITFKEPFGTEGRGGYFDEFGIIRDVMQNHLFQVLSILTMERPVSFSSEDIRDEKVKVLRYIPPVSVDECLLGQYTGAETKDGKKPGYLEDETVPKGSICPTFAAIVVHVNNPRWEGVPFILKAGKALNEQKTEIRIQYRDVTDGIFAEITRNELVIRVQPNEALYLKLNAKAPGLAMRTVPTEMDLTYKRRFSDLKIPEAYEALILDAFKGDSANFVRDDELDIAWKVFTPLLHYIDEKKPKPEPYEYGSRGPASLEDFVNKHGGYTRSEKPYT
ncbi:BZ3500_MvSof-1268-A1-R1_Chr10-2g02934 [Microbotryum saponariae]|uniref:Glucose-6-phosphate 1-dehydrogenase n=1 Tax=Microbotryum saponariae TaxID=289078 RepID=A0A2X0KAI4_9BASI|nr:BZ3501_MvSof-1269-A2-R1_Chr10-2g02520 [Microbotryum saponariae]SDA01773.1 BZ3500_MvSof-1268-A1-R1_Chr10-2g02934 [Microbotryum saponariae]